jgi:hypothetical protein
MANLIGVDPKDFRRFVRKFMRAQGLGDTLPGSGSRYSLDASQAEAWRDLYFADVRNGRRSVIDLDHIMLADDVTLTDDDDTPDGDV